MNIKKIIILSLLLTLFLAPISLADDGDYYIPTADKDILVNDDGSTQITEIINYEIEGSVNGVYRDIPHASDQSITNVSVETPGYYNTLEVIEENGRTRLKVWLYTDKNKQHKTYDANVKVIYKYTFNKGVKIYNDIAELQYMSWGNEWDSGVGNLVTTIHIPGSHEGTEYWNNPDDYVVSSSWTDDNTLSTQIEGIGSRTTFEQRILMPKSYFKSYENAKVINMDAKAKIEADQQKYKEDREFKNTLLGIVSGLLGILMIIPAGIYGLFGREPKIDYQADYEYDLPTDSSPVEVNSIVNGDVGSITDDAMYATLLDLIDRKFFKVISSSDDDTVLRLVNSDTSNLKTFERLLINFISKFEINGDISLKSIADNGDPYEFKDFKSSWIDETSKEVPESLINRYFIDKGSTLFSIFAFVLLFLSILVFFGIIFLEFGNYYWILLILSLAMFAESMIMLFIPNYVPGRWTPEGKEYHDKWENFQNYITDFSLIKERPPASIQVWGKYLVYAAALGCADEVSENMKKYFDIAGVPEEYFNSSDAVMFGYYGGFTHLNTTFTALTPSSDSSSSGIGSVGGGGFGGGGGGTF